MAANVMPRRLMRGQANATLRDRCDIERNDGAGWEVVAAAARCNVRHSDAQPAPADITDATASQNEVVEIHVPLLTPTRIGDRIRKTDAPTRWWTIGGGNWTEGRATFLSLRAARPTAAVPRVQVIVRRYNPNTQGRDFRPAQTVQLVIINRQPQDAGDAGRYIEGIVFSPEGMPPLDMVAGDQFLWGGRLADVVYVPPDPSDRREATFRITIGRG